MKQLFHEAAISSPAAPVLHLLLLLLLAPAAGANDKAPVTVAIKRLSLDTALTIAKAAVEKCRKEGVQVAVTVIDRGGHPQVVLRDVLAMDITLTLSRQKAYTAMIFNTATTALENRFPPSYDVPKVEGLIIVGGGLPIHAVGAIVGGIGVSGAPDPCVDEVCAQAGVDAVKDDLEMEDG